MLRARGPARTARALLAALAAAGACASLRPASVRELAREEYAIREGDKIVGHELLTLSTLPDFGKRLVSEVERPGASESRTRIDASLAPDWTIREATVVRKDAHGTAEWSLTYNGERQAFDVKFSATDRKSASFSAGGAFVFGDNAAFALVLARAYGLESGSPPVRGGAVAVGQAVDMPLTGTLTVQRAADRGRRQVYRYRLDFGEWRELETDQRGLPLRLTGAGVVVERLGSVKPEAK
jgi:hypothetical protein